MEKFSQLPSFLGNTPPTADSFNENKTQKTPLFAHKPAFLDNDAPPLADSANGFDQAETLTSTQTKAQPAQAATPMLKILFRHESAVRRITKG